MKLSLDLVFSDGSTLLWTVGDRHIVNENQYVRMHSSYRAAMFSVSDIIIKMPGSMREIAIEGPVKAGDLFDSVQNFFNQPITKEDYEFIFRTNLSVLFDQKRGEFKRNFRFYGDLFGKHMVIYLLKIKRRVYELSLQSPTCEG